MRRYLVLLAGLAGLAGALLLLLGPATPGHAAGRRGALPATDCVVEPISMTITAQTGPPADRPFANMAGDSYVQFLAPPITTTVSSSATLTVNGPFSGTIGGTLSGTATGDAANGVLVVNPGGLYPGPRGFTVSRLHLLTDQGPITATLATNFAALGFTPPYYPRVVNGYLASADMGGALAGKLLVVNLAGYETDTGGSATFMGSGLGRLFSGAAPLAAGVAGVRQTPQDRPVALQAGDLISQFRDPLITLASSGSGRLEPVTTLVGTLTGGGLNGGIAVPLNSLLLDTPGETGAGWQAGNLAFSDGTDAFDGVWLGDLRNSTSLSGQLYEIGGTGVYSSGMLFGNLDGTYLAGGAAFAGSFAGAYCTAGALPTPTTGASATATPTPVASATAPLPPTASATVAAATATPGTPPPASTATPSATGTPGPACAVTFSDVSPADYYYPAVEYLACHGVLSGYACGGPGEPCDPHDDPYFRAPANTTRGQLTKLVTNGLGWAIQTPVTPTFADVPAGQPFYAFIETAYAHGIISGYACGGPGEICDPARRPYFRPAANVTRGQLSKIITGAVGWPPGTPATPTFADVPATQPFFGAIEAAYAHGIISGYTCGGPGELCDPARRPYFRPYNAATRGQLSKILYNALLQR